MVCAVPVVEAAAVPADAADCAAALFGGPVELAAAPAAAVASPPMAVAVAVRPFVYTDREAALAAGGALAAEAGVSALQRAAYANAFANAAAEMGSAPPLATAVVGAAAAVIPVPVRCRGAFSDRVQALAAGRALAIKSGSSGAQAARYAATFADAAGQNGAIKPSLWLS